jgi:hypothetical protein
VRQWPELLIDLLYGLIWLALLITCLRTGVASRLWRAVAWPYLRLRAMRSGPRFVVMTGVTVLIAVVVLGALLAGRSRTTAYTTSDGLTNYSPSSDRCANNGPYVSGGHWWTAKDGSDPLNKKYTVLRVTQSWFHPPTGVFIGPDGSQHKAGRDGFWNMECRIPGPAPAPEPLPIASQPPDPCQLLTVDEVTSAVGEPVDVPMPAGPAQSDGYGERTCGWAGRLGSGVALSVSITTTASHQAAQTAQEQSVLGPPDTTVMESLPRIFAAHLLASVRTQVHADKVLNYPAEYGVVTGWVPPLPIPSSWVQVLTPTALVTVSYGACQPS